MPCATRKTELLRYNENMTSYGLGACLVRSARRLSAGAGIYSGPLRGAGKNYEKTMKKPLHFLSACVIIIAMTVMNDETDVESGLSPLFSL